MTHPIFSTYSQGENRITSTIIAVLERLSFSLSEAILLSLCQDSQESLMTFTNQAVGPRSTPDAVIRASFAIYVETKRYRDCLDAKQIRRHLQMLDRDRKVEQQRLLLLTPDSRQPKILSSIRDPRIRWACFDDVLAAIQGVIRPLDESLVTDTPTPTEREVELLRELARFLIAEGLIGARKEQVVVVAARLAYDEYRRLGVYFCRPHRPFQPSSHLGFYSQGAIQRHVPRILGQIESITLNEASVRKHVDAGIRRQLVALVAMLKKDPADRKRDDDHDFKRYGSRLKVMLLSPPDAPETLVLPEEIPNDLPAAFVRKQRYIALKAFEQAPATTSRLLELDAQSNRES